MVASNTIAPAVRITDSFTCDLSFIDGSTGPSSPHTVTLLDSPASPRPSAQAAFLALILEKLEHHIQHEPQPCARHDERDPHWCSIVDAEPPRGACCEVRPQLSKHAGQDIRKS